MIKTGRLTGSKFKNFKPSRQAYKGDGNANGIAIDTPVSNVNANGNGIAMDTS
jgi:hypothetical protein